MLKSAVSMLQFELRTLWDVPECALSPLTDWGLYHSHLKLSFPEWIGYLCYIHS